MKKYLAICATSLLFIVGCTDNFEEINTNPNQPEQVSSDLLLSTAITTLANETVGNGWGNGNLVAQLTAKINFTGFDRYNWGTESGTWNTLYGIVPEINTILENATQEGSKNTSYEGIALVLRANVFALLTDSWGDIPYSEAIAGSEGVFTPVYDTQEAVYAGVLEDLRRAETQLALGQIIQGGDVLFEGDTDKWRKLANSLRLRYLLRISGKTNVGTEIQGILDSGMFISTNDESAAMVYPATTRVDSWSLSTSRIGSFDEHRMSTTSEAILKQLNDGRLQKWFQPTDNPSDDPTLFAGMTNGLSEDNASTFNGGASNVSRLNQSFFYDSPNSVKAAIIQAAEVQFIFAEAAQKGLISGDAETFYNEGVRLSFEYWEVDQDVPTYLSQVGASYDGELETIITQKWLASFLVGMEAWYDFRRTGFPSVIVPGPDNVNDDRVPVRFLYPDSEQTLNTENYNAAVSRIGGDDINTKGWWEQ